MIIAYSALSDVKQLKTILLSYLVEAVAAHRDVISKREEDLKFKLAEAAEMQAAAQRAEDVDWQACIIYTQTHYIIVYNASIHAVIILCQ